MRTVLILRPVRRKVSTGFRLCLAAWSISSSWGLFTREFVQNVRMGFFALLKFKQKTSWCPTATGAPGLVENEKQMLATKSPVSYGGRAHVNHRTTTMRPFLWSPRDRVSIDLRIDDNCKRSNGAALPGFIASPTHPLSHGFPSPWASEPRASPGPRRRLRCPPTGRRSQSLEPCGLSEVFALLFLRLFIGGWKWGTF